MKYGMRRRDVLRMAFWTSCIIWAQTRQSAPDSSLAIERGVALLRKMQIALGGADRLAAIHDLDWTVNAKSWNASGSPGLDITRRIRWISPNIFRKDQQAGNLKVIEFFDGSGGWELTPDGGLLELEGSELEIVRQEVTSFWINIVLADRNPNFKVRSDGDDVIRVVSSDGKDADDIAVDPGTGLPLRSFGTVLSGTVTSDYRRVRDRTEYSEWQTVGRIQWPHKTVKFHDDVRRAEITTAEIKLNVGIRLPDLSAKPR
jgi:hypothetical protein